ncbi:hypothetical protein [Lactococcus lactis]|uniref:Uncharacterized protein n=1 Tax=Lactococcus lactis subsp. lactis NCDO 2118 TaxID=1117941 RepID=A0ABC8A4F3_LACLL|nr:hypothetical protein [Lactococcus lactis]ABX75592.1 Hypothetical protein LLKF_0603 [Lactococcus lactis subsp. lactis KF147]AII12104.1 Hypothetical protein NCDO2118_0608 [Lactococcus lactis subsp. lactis NCDO 2118]
MSDDTKQKINQHFGTLLDYRNPKGTFLKDFPMTQQQAIKELFNMLEFAYRLEKTKRKIDDI